MVAPERTGMAADRKFYGMPLTAMVVGSVVGAGSSPSTRFGVATGPFGAIAGHSQRLVLRRPKSSVERKADNPHGLRIFSAPYPLPPGFPDRCTAPDRVLDYESDLPFADELVRLLYGKYRQAQIAA